MMAAPVTPLTNGDLQLDPHQDIVAALSTSSHSFLQPTAALHTAAVLAAKRSLDPLAFAVCETQELRKRERRKKRKRSDYESDVPGKVLQLREVHTEGFGIGQIWEQAKRILDAARGEVERDLRSLQASPTAVVGGEEKPQRDVQNVQLAEDDLRMRPDVDADHFDAVENPSFAGQVGLDDGKSELEAEEGVDGGNGEDEQDGDIAEEDLEDISNSEGYLETEERPQTYIPDPNGLNDGFFSIDDFNKQSQFLEQQDGIGEDDTPSDEDEIDWDANPLTTPLPSKSGSKKREARESDSEDSDGPTFGNADLNASSEGEEDSDLNLQENVPGLENTNEIKYADFFEPPPRKPSKNKRMRALPKTQPAPRANTSSQNPQDIDDDIQRAISDVRRDLLASEDEAAEDESSDESEKEGRQPLRTSSNIVLSTHEKQRAKIAAEIRRLEAAATSKRDWTLSGEARAADRPVNSLIEENLEFERAGKPVPVITAEVSEEIEALVKRRIIAREFDEVVRRRPEALGAADSVRRGRVELDDTKPGQGLADVYEAEHLKATDPGYVDKRSAAVKKQHDEIARMWKDVSSKLDVLSNLHFKPKRADISVQVVSDKPTISMEDARPGAAEGGAESRLAPQEIYVPGEKGRIGGEIVGKGGMARSKDEMTREEKLRRRRREKERAKKRKSSAVTQQDQPGKHGRTAQRAQVKRNILDELRKGGVKVIGKKGEVEAIDGKKRKGPREVERRSIAYKL
jgi:U3 small nucleolar RNA-associated protein MPP10